MTSREFHPDVINSLPMHKRGLVELHRAQRSYDRRMSPKGRAGALGGKISARLHPHRPRDKRGRYITGPIRPSRAGATATAAGKSGQEVPTLPRTVPRTSHLDAALCTAGAANHQRTEQ
jgi:hypothetical protein